jgi:hypothetical protein
MFNWTPILNNWMKQLPENFNEQHGFGSPTILITSYQTWPTLRDNPGCSWVARQHVWAWLLRSHWLMSFSTYLNMYIYIKASEKQIWKTHLSYVPTSPTLSWINHWDKNWLKNCLKGPFPKQPRYPFILCQSLKSFQLLVTGCEYHLRWHTPKGHFT